MKSIFDIFGFDEIRAKLATHTKTVRGRDFSTSLALFKDLQSLKEELALMKEVQAYIFQHGELPLNNSSDLTIPFKSARFGNVLTPADFDHINSDIKASIKIAKMALSKIAKDSLLAKVIAQFIDLTALSNKIETVISPNLTIKDSASPALKKIRREILTLENKISRTSGELLNTYKNVISDSIITIRNGHYVIPIKASEKYNVNGIIHDISATGQTVYIEPSQIVELNNRLINAQNEELMEINRILRELTSEMLLNEEAILKNNQTIGRLDFIFAKGLLGRATNSYVANLSETQEIYLPKARHPLIDENVVVANTFEINDVNRIVVITGPNAGGKTVALKTIGLLVMMNQSGLLLPTDGEARLGYFKSIFADIGDQQSLSDNLSTFSAHIGNIRDITNRIKRNDLVLIDELGTGTDPVEGEALALALLDFFKENGAIAVISSHFSKLKTYAFSTPGVINASMLFDEKALKPLYIFKLGLPGKSYGLSVATKHGLSEQIIKAAQSYMDGAGHLVVEETLSRLNEEVEKSERVNKELLVRQKELDRHVRENENLRKRLEAKMATFDEDYTQEIEERKLEVEQQLDLLLKRAYQGDLKPHEIIALKSNLQEDIAPLVQVDEEKEEIVVGDYVHLETLGSDAKVIKISGKRVEVQLTSGLPVKTKMAELVKISRANLVRPKKQAIVETILLDDTPVKMELNLIGLRVDEALNELSRYLDRCLSKKFGTVRIIHGFGSGALRKAVHEYLKTQSYVKAYYLAGAYDGAGGATVVELK